VILCCVTGSEHAVATWLSSFGVEVGHESEQTMALMSSCFWSLICAGRVVWCVASEFITSAWPMLFADIFCMLSGSLMFLWYSLDPSYNWVLWAASCFVALGVSSSLPCVITLPRECNMQITPGALMALNVAGTLGEIFFPGLIGMAFEAKLYMALSVLLTSAQALTLVNAVTGFMALGGGRGSTRKEDDEQMPRW